MRLYDTASFFSLLTWSWVSPLLARGQHVLLDDISDLAEEDQASQLLTNMRKEWESEKKEAMHAGHDPSMKKVIGRVFGTRLGKCGMILVAFLTCLLCQPMILRQLIGALEDNSSTGVCFLYALIVNIAVLGQTITVHQLFACSFRVGIQIRIALSAIVFEKATRLSSSALGGSSSGQLVNLISNDAEKFELWAVFVHYIWAGPLFAIVAFFLVANEVGWYSALIGFTALIFSIPLQSYFSSRFSAIRKNTINFTDQRVKSINEMLLGASIMKLYAWEEALVKQVNHHREREFGSISEATVFRALNVSLFFIVAPFLTFITLTSFVLLGGTLTAVHVFTIISLFYTVRYPVGLNLPLGVEKFAEVTIAIARLDKFLNTPELDKSAFCSDAPSDLALEMRNASFTWMEKSEVKNDSSNVLLDLNVKIKKGSLVGIVGAIGSGKSSLFAAILGEMNQTNGEYIFCSKLKRASFSYASQKSWIFSDTVKNNILFQRPYDEERYHRTVAACQLEADIKLFHAGDETLIGERGVNLSGGQKARISLARACYAADCDIYLLDDPLAAVDAVVANKLMSQVVGLNDETEPLLQGTTRILVTHHTHFLQYVDQIIVLQAGKIIFSGSFAELQISQLDLNSIFDSTESESRGVDEIMHATKHSNIAEIDSKNHSTEFRPILEDQNKIINAEVVQKGELEDRVISNFIEAAGGKLLVLLLCLLMIFSQAVLCSGDWYLSYWLQLSASEQIEPMYLGIYACLVGLCICLSLLRSQLFFRIILGASSNLHSKMFQGVLYSPLSFFESQPAGRVLNRFAKDQNVMDDLFPYTLFDFVQSSLYVVAAMVMIGISSPFVLLLLIPIFPIFIYLRRVFIEVNREIKRLEAASRSPIYALFSSTLSGLMTIRTFGVSNNLLHRFFETLDVNFRCRFAFEIINRWFGFRLDLLTQLVVLLTTFIAAGTKGSVNAAYVSLSLVYVLQLTTLFQWTIRQSAEAESQLTSVERILEYCRLPEEGQRITKFRPPQSWPEKGEIEFHDVKMRYRENLPLVLNEVNASISACDKIGICGRTGAGKSSLLSVLYRLVPLSGGTIIIDGLNINEIGLFDLRSKLSIIPQDAVIFSGSVRYNCVLFVLVF